MQSSLFDAPIDSGTARKSDRWSSREAARRTRPAKAKDIILSAFIANGGTGTLDVAHEAMIAAGQYRAQRGTISRRIRDLADEGVIQGTGRHVDGSYGTPLEVWQVVR